MGHRESAACRGTICGGSPEWPQSAGGAPTVFSKHYGGHSLTSSREQRLPNRLTYIFKEGSCLQHYFLEVEADVSVCEQSQDLFQSFQAFTDDFGASQVVQASDDTF